MDLNHDRPIARKFAIAARTARQHLPDGFPPAFFLTDPNRIDDPVVVAERLPRGFGIIYRHFGAPDRVEIAIQLARVSAGRGLTLLIAADPDLAHAVGADGVHWPERLRQSALSSRGTVGLQTTSAHSARSLRQADHQGFDAAFVSAVFPSRSPSAGTPLGLARYRSLVKTVSIPCYGLGGINSSNALAIARLGGFACVEGLAG